VSEKLAPEHFNEQSLCQRHFVTTESLLCSRTSNHSLVVSIDVAIGIKVDKKNRHLTGMRDAICR